MDELSQGLERILSNPQAMQQIISLANSLGGPGEGPVQEPERDADKAEAPPSPAGTGTTRVPGPDFLKLLSQAGMDRDQQNLLGALKPYLEDNKLQKLQRAMEAAKIAQLALGLLGGRNMGGEHV